MISFFNKKKTLYIILMRSINPVHIFKERVDFEPLAVKQGGEGT